MRKIIALLLSVCMTVGFGTSVFAYSDVKPGTVTSEAVNLLSDLGIIDGFEDGTYKPGQTVTRAEMAKIICEMLDLTIGTATTSVYDDVPTTHWAAGYINTISAMGIICGYGDGNYGPEDTVTYEQAIKMIVCALGYEPMATAKGGYPQGYVAVASSIGLLKNVSSSNRGDIAVLVYSALHTPVMKQTSFGTNDTYKPLDGSNGTEYKTLLTSRDIYIATGIVGKTYNNDRVEFTFTRDSKDNEFEKGETENFYIGKSNILDYTHQEIETYVEKDNDDDYTVIAISATAKTETFTLVSDDIVSAKNGVIKYYVDSNNSSKTKTLNVDDNVTIEFNKNSDEVTDISFFENKEDITITFIENDGDSKYDAIVATLYTSERLTKVDASRDKITLANKSVEFDFDDKDKTYVFVNQDGDILELSDFAEDDVVAWYCDSYTIETNDNIKFDPKTADYIEIVKLADSAIEGVVDSVGSDYVTIDGETYDVVSSVWDEVSKPGTEGIFYVGMTGKIIDFDGSTATANYGYILQVGTSSSTFDDTVIVELLTSKGVVRYNTTAKATESIKSILGDDVDWNIEVNDNRFIIYKINSAGKLSKIEKVTDLKKKSLDNDVYRDNTESINGSYIDKNTLIFVINEKDSEDCFVTDMNYLVDEGKYSGALYAKNGDTRVVFITATDAEFNSENGVCIVTEISTKSVDGDKVIAVSYVQNENEDVVYFDDDTDVDEDTFDIGTVFVFNATADKYATKYMKIANIVDKDFAYDTEYDSDKLSDDVELVFGYIYNETSKINSKGELIIVSNDGKTDGETYVIPSKAYKYTYRKANRSYTVETEDFLAGDAYYRETDEGINYVTPVMIKLVDDVVVDIYTISSRIEVK